MSLVLLVIIDVFRSCLTLYLFLIAQFTSALSLTAWQRQLLLEERRKRPKSDIAIHYVLGGNKTEKKMSNSVFLRRNIDEVYRNNKLNWLTYS